MQIQQPLARGGECSSKLLPVAGVDLHRHGVPETGGQPFSLWNHQMVLRPELPGVMGLQQLFGRQQPDLVSRWRLIACPAPKLQSALQQTWSFDLEQPLLLAFIEHQHGVTTPQAERHQQGQPPALAAASGKLDSGSILSAQASPHQPAQCQLMLPMACFPPEQVFELLMGLDFQHPASLRTAVPRIGSG